MPGKRASVNWTLLCYLNFLSSKLLGQTMSLHCELYKPSET
jgi:hypothetical protein